MGFGQVAEDYPSERLAMRAGVAHDSLMSVAALHSAVGAPRRGDGRPTAFAWLERLCGARRRASAFAWREQRRHRDRSRERRAVAVLALTIIKESRSRRWPR